MRLWVKQFPQNVSEKTVINFCQKKFHNNFSTHSRIDIIMIIIKVTINLSWIWKILLLEITAATHCLWKNNLTRIFSTVHLSIVICWVPVIKKITNFSRIFPNFFWNEKYVLWNKEYVPLPCYSCRVLALYPVYTLHDQANIEQSSSKNWGNVKQIWTMHKA